MKYLAYLFLILTIAFNLCLNFPETKILADPNDNIFQYSLVARTDWVWKNYGCPLSLSCLPNLIDHNVPAWAEGYPLPFYYSHIPQIAIVSSYHLFIKPFFSLLTSHFSLYQYYTLTRYLLLCFFPLPVFFALRIVGFSPILASLGGFFAGHFSTDGLYGIDPPSFLWRGYGLTSQLYAMFFLPLGLAFTYKALSKSAKCKVQSAKLQLKAKSVGNRVDYLRGEGENFAQSAPKEERAEKRLWTESVSSRALCRLATIFSRPQRRYRKWQDPQITIRSDKYNIFWAALFLTLTTAGHLGMGIIGLFSTLPFLFLDLKPKNIYRRAKKAFLIYIILFISLSYWIIPILLNNHYHIVSFWDPIWKFNSYGWYEVVRQFFQGEIFDWGRPKIITGLALIGFFVMAQNTHFFPFALLFAIWILTYFGRTTWGGLIDLIPGMKDFHQHRFIVGVQIAALFLIPAGLNYIFSLLRKTIEKTTLILNLLINIVHVNSKFKSPWPDRQGRQKSKTQLKSQNHVRRGQNFIMDSLILSAGGTIGGFTLNGFTMKGTPIKGAANNLSEHLMGVNRDRTRKLKYWPPQLYTNIIFYILSFTFISILVYFTAKQTVEYAKMNNIWIDQANRAYFQDEQNFQNLKNYLRTLPSARIYAGRPGNWGKQFRLGSTELYMLLGIYGFDMSQFLPETWSMLSENEQNFDERITEDYDLLNIRYVVADRNHDFTEKAKMVEKFGPFELYQVPTTGWFDVITSPMFVKTDKTNFINLVHFWHRSYPRRWKMHPLISVEKKPEIPPGMQKIIEMKDEVTYDSKNIFSDFPFIFPEATPSGQIKEEKVKKQTYSAIIEVPPDCKENCYIMFKMSYHPNWHLKVDGQPATKYAVFPFYLAAKTSPGTHRIEFTYKPNKLKVMLLVGEIIVGVISVFIINLSSSRKRGSR